MAKKQSINKRVITFKYSDSSLTSKRVSIILSSPEDSKKLAKAVRALRNSGDSSFTITSQTKEKIDKEAKKLQTA
jgi:hypothetical protein